MKNHDKFFLIFYFTIYSVFIKSDSEVLRLAGMGGLILFQLLSILLKRDKVSLSLRIITFLILIIIIPLLRSSLSGTISFNFFFLNILFFATFLIYINALIKRTDWNTVFSSLKHSLYLFLILNFFLFVLGITQEVIPEEAVMWKNFGINTERVFFFLSPGINAMGSIAGLSLLLAGYDIKQKRINQTVGIGILIISLLTVLFTDSRGAVMSLIGTYVLSFFFLEKFFFKSLYFQPILVFIGIGIFLFLLMSIESEFITDITRGNFILSGREIIWISALRRIANDPFHLFFGFGYLGQSISKVYEDYYFIFGSHRNPETMSLHNYILQNIYDVGLIGLYGLLFNIKVAFRRCELSGETAFLTFILILGILEVSVNIYSFYIFSILIVFLLKPTKTKRDENPITN